MEIAYNEAYFLKDGKPWFPTTGEMHFSRTRREDWETSLYKMKACGIEAVATYVFWNHHEEIENEWDFSGNKDLHAFALTAKKCGMLMYLRIGPWAHGEARNGGFPDWLCLKLGDRIRTNDSEYLKFAEGFYKKIYEQVAGMMMKDGGHIFGIQIENEYGQCGGLTGDEGEKHINHLKNMAQSIGLDVPIYTATGWGGACTGGLLDVWGGYPEAPWEWHNKEYPPFDTYNITSNKNDDMIASNYRKRCLFSDAALADVPYATAELGGGVQVTYSRRPVISGKDISAITLCRLAGGVTLLGYYMFHGGTNPRGKLTSLNESPNGIDMPCCSSIVPIYSYDFQAPIGEYGRVNDRFSELRMLLTMVRDFGEDLAQMKAIFPKKQIKSDDLCSLRTGIRCKGDSGYVFVNNYVRHYKMAEHKNVSLSVPTDNGDILFPPVNIKDGQFFMWPFNMPIGNGVLKYATGTPLCVLNRETYVFYGEHDFKYEFVKKPDNAHIMWLPRADAERAQRIVADKEYLVISEALVMNERDRITLTACGSCSLKAYPEFSAAPAGFEKCGTDGEFTVYKRLYPAATVPNVNYAPTDKIAPESSNSEKYRDFEINISEIPENAEDIYLNIDYEGESARIYVDGEFVADDFYRGIPWQIGIKRWNFPKTMQIRIYTLYEKDNLYIYNMPEFDSDGSVCRLNGIKPETEEKISLF